MRNGHGVGRGRRGATGPDPSDPSDVAAHGGRPHHPHHRGGPRGRRLFDYGDLRLVLLAMLAEQPRHGYELMKAIEERFAGAYSPSPGVIYPTLSWLDDMGYATAEAAGGGRKCYSVTPEGEAFLTANRATVDELLARIGTTGDGRPHGMPMPVMRAMENLKTALRLRLRGPALDESAAQHIADALDTAARSVETA